jgi:hypothetical protein
MSKSSDSTFCSKKPKTIGSNYLVTTPTSNFVIPNNPVIKPTTKATIQERRPVQTTNKAMYVRGTSTNSSTAILYLCHAIEEGKKGNSDEEKCEYNNTSMTDCCIKTGDDVTLHVSKYIIATHSPEFNKLFNQTPSMDEINMTEFKSADVKEWLLRWHPVPGYAMERYTPTKNIGIYMMLCYKYGMQSLLDFAISSLSLLNAADNLDLVSIVNKSVMDGDALFKVSNVYSILTVWIQTKSVPKEFVESLSPKFLHMCLLLSKRTNNNNRIHDRKILVDCPACNLCVTHSKLPECECGICKKSESQ